MNCYPQARVSWSTRTNADRREEAAPVSRHGAGHRRSPAALRSGRGRPPWADPGRRGARRGGAGAGRRREERRGGAGAGRRREAVRGSGGRERRAEQARARACSGRRVRVRTSLFFYLSYACIYIFSVRAYFFLCIFKEPTE